jgi:penicillin amidase
MHQLMPPYPADGLSILLKGAGPDLTKIAGNRISEQPSRDERSRPSVDPRQGAAGAGPLAFSDALSAALSQGHEAVRDILLGGGRHETLGSNNWVVDGTVTATGMPLLANDTHLGAQVPSIWYLAHWSVGDTDVIGATLPGIPAVALGRNRRIAWGATNTYADVQDLYRERIDPDGKAVEFRGGVEPLTIVPETIVVRGGSPVRLDVRLTRHGPLISDAINANNAELPRVRRPQPLEPLALRWTALDADDSTLPAFFRLNAAQSWNDFTEALRDFVVPSQNFVYADVGGHIGYYAPGRIPIRARGDGTLPVDGWSGENEWIGWIPFERLPRAADPANHFIVTANHRPVSGDYPYTIAVDWPDPYRAMRITELLTGRRGFTPDDFARIQGDTVSVHARELLPLLIRRARPQSSEAKQAIELLRQWEGDLRPASNAAAIFEAWFLRLPPAIAGDALGARTTRSYAGRLRFVSRFLLKTLSVDDSSWCDDVRTSAPESCDHIVTMALEEAILDLRRRLGPDVNRWRWDGVHRAIFPHQGMDGVAALRPFLSRSVPNGGDWSTVNVGMVSTERPYDQRAVAGYRAILDLSADGDSRFGIDVGQSGHFLSPHYADFLEDWRAVRHKKMRTARPDIERDAIGRLRLQPR